MSRVAPLSRVVLNVTKYTVLFSYLGLLVLVSAGEISYAAEHSLGLPRAIKQLAVWPLQAGFAALVVGLPLGLILGALVAFALATFHRRAPNRRRLRFTVELITLLAILPGAYALSDSMHSLVGTPARLLAAVRFPPHGLIARRRRMP